MGIAARVNDSIRTLTPGYFALVMASGIVSVALQQRGWMAISYVLFAIAGLAYIVLVALSIVRFIRYRAEMAADFQAPMRAFGFFTFVAGTNVLGTRAAGEGWMELTAVLLGVAAAAWLVMGYVIPWSAVVGRSERPVVALANGTWFIWVVASQSVAVSAGALANHYTGARQALAVLAVMAWSVGVFLYAASAIIVSLRIMLYQFEPEDLNPPYWVSMGAIAITVVAGARIVDMESAPMVDATRALIAGLSVVFWAFATWLIPVLIFAGLWRHWIRRVPLRYEATLWSIVFPLGMYSVASMWLGEADSLPIVGGIGANWLWVAVTAWVLTFVAMSRNVWRILTGRTKPPAPAAAPPEADDSDGAAQPPETDESAGMKEPAGPEEPAGTKDPAEPEGASVPQSAPK
ncbi:MAG: tellurite resistance/C4-dicarboxylate transporter family protein [Beutenbergiaceae bacterium]